MSNEPKYTFKILTLGESGVGKTCIISRYISGNFDESSATTNGLTGLRNSDAK